jgi:hypothetical protein
MDANLMIILTATLAVTSALSLVVFLNLLFMKIQWNDKTIFGKSNALAESDYNNYAAYNFDSRNFEKTN